MNAPDPAALPLDSAALRESLLAFFARATGSTQAEITRLTRMSGGAIQENWALDALLRDGPFEGRREWVVRTDAPSTVATSLSRAQEYAVLTVVRQARVLVPEPLWLCTDRKVIGRDFFVMQRLPGTAVGHRLARDDALVPNRERLAVQLGANLARIHSIVPPNDPLSFLSVPANGPALAMIEGCRADLDRLRSPHPALEWGLRWCERHRPRSEHVTLVHGDYRTGNYLVDRGELTGVLDWEFAAWGNPLSDIGWCFAKCWRFGRNALHAGGVAHAEDFIAGYESVSGRPLDAAGVAYWEVVAHLRWAVIALQQAQRHRSGVERSLELTLTGRIVSALELEALVMTAESAS